MVHRENAVMCFGIRKAQQPDSFSEKGDNIGKDRKSWMENKITGGEGGWTMEFGNLFFWISLCLMVLLVFFERKDPKTLWAWLLVLTFMPAAGLLLYVLAGQNYRRKKLFHLKEMEDELAADAGCAGAADGVAGKIGNGAGDGAV